MTDKVNATEGSSPLQEALRTSEKALAEYKGHFWQRLRVVYDKENRPVRIEKEHVLTTWHRLHFGGKDDEKYSYRLDDVICAIQTLFNDRHPVELTPPAEGAPSAQRTGTVATPGTGEKATNKYIIQIASRILVEKRTRQLHHPKTQLEKIYGLPVATPFEMELTEENLKAMATHEGKSYLCEQRGEEFYIWYDEAKMKISVQGKRAHEQKSQDDLLEITIERVKKQEGKPPKDVEKISLKAAITSESSVPEIAKQLAKKRFAWFNLGIYRLLTPPHS